MRNPYRRPTSSQARRVAVRHSPVLRRIASFGEDARMVDYMPDVQDVISDIEFFERNGDPDTLQRIVEGMEMLEEYGIDLSDAAYELDNAYGQIEGALTEAYLKVHEVKTQLRRL